MGVARPCIKCGALLEHGSYCPGCAPARMRGRKWMRRRAVVFRRAGWICERCHDRVAEEVHHLGGAGRQRVGALMAVCRDCHRELEREKRG